MADLDDAEDAIAQQEAWGTSLTDLAVKRLARAVRAARAILASHGNRLDAVEARLDALDPASAPAAESPAEPLPEL